MTLIETLKIFGMGAAMIIYLLVERAGKVKLLRSPQAKFLAPGIIALVLVAAVYLAQSPRPPVYLVLLTWLGLWVSAMMVKSTVKDGGTKPPDKPTV
jgi:hypothetical protein